MISVIILIGSALFAVFELIRGNPFVAVLPLALVVFVLLIYVGYRHDWTGFGDFPLDKKITQEFRPRKTLWDWMSLLLVPLMLAVIGFWAVWAQNNNLQAMQAQNAALQSYLDQMQDLIIDKDLLSASASNESEDRIAARYVARARTLSVLRGLSPEGKGAVLRFLYDSGLIKGTTPTVDLKGADLTGADLTRADLHGVNLEGVDLEDADMEAVDLTGANLLGAELAGADLEEACLKKATLPAADSLSLADLEDTNLLGAVVYGGADKLNDNTWATLVRMWRNLRHAGLRAPDIYGSTLSKEVEEGSEADGCKKR
jgi:uncharacterized protein YjbI with pentapeptide repeats